MFYSWKLNMNRESQRLPTSLISEGLKNSANFFWKYSLLNTTPNLIWLRFKISDLFSITPFSFTEFKGQNLDKKISSLLLTEGNEINCVNHEPSNKIFDCCTIDFQTFNRVIIINLTVISRKCQTNLLNLL